MQESVDIASCATEPIHVPGAIQPHGLLLVLDEGSPGLEVLQGSDNAEALVGRPIRGLLGRPLAEMLDQDDLRRLTQALRAPDLRTVNPVPLTLASRVFDGIVHRATAGLVLELEPRAASTGVDFFSFYHDVRGSVLRLSTAGTLGDAARAAVHEVKRLTGFDRVLIYRFDEQWNGETIAEDADAGMDRYLGLRFPATDIPVQARALYAKNWLRLIADVDYRPAPVVPAVSPASGQPLDMTYSALRSVSPVHRQYMRNMRTASSMSISIMKDDRLWGLISCHSRGPRYVPYRVRSGCEFIGQAFSAQITAIEGREDVAVRAGLRHTVQELTRRIARHGVADGLTQSCEQLIGLVGAAGAALCFKERIIGIGAAPSEATIRLLLDDVRRATRAGDVFCTTAWAPGTAVAACDEDAGVTGVLALPITSEHDDYLVWFRPELVRTVEWAGDPRKGQASPIAGQTLGPRQSFELWKETVRGTSAPWSAAEIDAAANLRNEVVAHELSRLNASLARSNAELDAFAYIATHDLKEPLRGIRNYASFVLEDEGGLKDDSRARLETIGLLTRRMERLLDSLYHYSKVGRVELAFVSTDLDEMLDDVLIRLTPTLQERRVAVRRPSRLPRVRCDAVRVGEVFYNLVANAAKYNDKPEPWIEVGWDGDATFHVRDNGIGIADKHREDVFTMFRRLHGRDGPFGDGTGTGLTIAKRIVELHGGRLWVDSAPGVGTTFYFDLGGGDASAQAEPS
jgi:light-regulated signal transduction histidine kinase (bacteriophytochrome)